MPAKRCRVHGLLLHQWVIKPARRIRHRVLNYGFGRIFCHRHREHQ